MLNSNNFVSLINRVIYKALRDRGKTNETLSPNLVQARIDPGYVSGRPSVVFDGEETISGKQYPYLSSYVPAPNDVVLLARVSGTFVILGKKI